MIYTTSYTSPLGKLLLASDGTSLIGLWLEGQKYFLSTVTEKRIEKNDVPIFIETKKWLAQYFAGENPAISSLKLAPRGSEFRQYVWQELCKIPYGKTMTYGEIGKHVALLMGKESMANQAVGGAVGHNPLSIIVPCHRVIGASGSLTGYAGGIQQKIKLLTLEGVDVSRLTIPKKGTAL